MDEQDVQPRSLLDPRVQLPPTTWEQREPFYENVEELLMPGFISHSVWVGEHSLCLRSPLPGDLYLIRLRTRALNREDWMLWSIATCTWMVDGVVLLGSREAPLKLYQVYKQLPMVLKKVLVHVFFALYGKMAEAAPKIAAYAQESRSRVLWKQMHGRLPNDEMLTGIPGSGTLGLNVLQRMWGVYNEVEDRRQAEQVAWQNAKFIASAHSPKGVRQISDREKATLAEEERRRQVVLDNLYYQCIGVLNEDDTLADGRKITRATKTVEQLSAEFHQWVAGEKDFHDNVVEDYKRKVVERYEAERRSREESYRSLRENPESMEVPADQPLVGYDLSQLQELFQERGQSPNVRRVYDSQEAKREYIYSEFLTKAEAAPPPGGFTLNREGKPIIPKGNATLDDQIRQRRFQIGKAPTTTGGEE